MSQAPQPSLGARPRSCLAIILAAGEGTRMNSARPKVLHAIAGRSMLAHVLRAVEAAGATSIAVVVGPGRADVEAEVEATCPGAQVFVQAERLGTAHAVLAARAAIEVGADDVVVAYGDTPLVTPATLHALRTPLNDSSTVAVLGFEAEDPTGYGRLIRDGTRLEAIREERDASLDERAITLCNAGLMAFRGDAALSLLDAVGRDNAKGEYYLTDVVSVAVGRGEVAGVVTAPEAEVQGVNDRVQLAAAEAAIQARLRAAAIVGGATLAAPDTVFFSADTRLGRDVTVDPHVVFGPGVTVADGVAIRAFSHLEGAIVGANAIVGPFARLRPGTVLGAGVHVGNFVEVKNSELAEGVKANHLTYIGDATVGARTNVGAGTVTCNYDGVAKHRTTIGADAFIGVNSALVAPISVGEGAYVATGSVVTEDVPPDALAFARARQVNKPDRASDLRAKLKAGRR